MQIVNVLNNDRSFNTINTAIGLLAKTGPGFLDSIIINNAGTAWEVDVYDGTSSSGTRMAAIRSGSFGDSQYGIPFANGLFIDAAKNTVVGELIVKYK